MSSGNRKIDGGTQCEALQRSVRHPCFIAGLTMNRLHNLGRALVEELGKAQSRIGILELGVNQLNSLDF